VDAYQAKDVDKFVRAGGY